MQKLLSVIIPVYNVDLYLEECIESVLKQTYAKLEIILVDDGSTDESGAICDRYAGQDSRIQVIHTKNSGVVEARNTGLKSAEGYYIAFVDSDDWIEPDMYEFLIREMEQNPVEVISSGCFLECGQDAITVYDGLEEGIYLRESCDLCAKMFFCNNYETSGIFSGIWSKIYKKDKITEFCYALDRQMVFGEDAAFLYSYLPYAGSVRVLHKAFYHYRERQTSVMHTPNCHILQSISLMYTYTRKFLHNHECYPLMRKQLQLYVTQQTLKGLNHHMDFDEAVKIPYYLLPHNLISFGGKVALYGAGKVGQAYAKQLQTGENYELIIWVDREYEAYCKQGIAVSPVEELLANSFDVILIAVQKEEIAASIKKDLLARGMEERKIYWECPKTILEVCVPFDREEKK